MKVKIHFISIRKLLHKLPQLLQSIKQLYTSSPVKVIWLDQPNISTLVHLIIKVKFSVNHTFVFALGLYRLILSYMLIYLIDLLLNMPLVLLFYTFYTIKELTKLVDFLKAVLGWEVDYELNW